MSATGAGADERPDPAEVARSLRAVLAAVNAGEVEADEAQRAYLSGAANALDGMSALPDPM